MLPRLLFVLGIGLPLHGGITVFFPDMVRWWKEIVLLLVIVLVIFQIWQQRELLLKQLAPTKKWLQSPTLWAVLLLVWLSFLVLINGDWGTSLTAARYLALSFVVYLIIWTLKPLFGAKKAKNFFHNFSTGWLTGSALSVLFGMWAQFAGGYQVLGQWYSNTISSWVPGQTLPLYHQTSEGVIRMQGLSAGPVEFGHLLLLSLWLSLQSSVLWVRLLSIFFLAGIYWSGSRAALLGAVLIWGYYFIKSCCPLLKIKRPFWHQSLAVNLVVLLVLASSTLGAVKYVVSELPDSHFDRVVRLSDSDHITRPIEAFKIGMQRPVLGNLGKLGPAARAKNLQVNNNDQAPIAENVFVDYFAQLGLIGVILASAFWVTWCVTICKRRQYDWLTLGAVMLLLMNLATILDMSPISIAWFAVLGFGTTLSLSKH